MSMTPSENYYTNYMVDKIYDMQARGDTRSFEAIESELWRNKVDELSKINNDRYSEMVRLQNCNLEHGINIKSLESQLKEKDALLKEAAELLKGYYSTAVKYSDLVTIAYKAQDFVQKPEVKKIMDKND